MNTSACTLNTAWPSQATTTATAHGVERRIECAEHVEDMDLEQHLGNWKARNTSTGDNKNWAAVSDPA